MKKLLLLAFVVLGISAVSFGQKSASADASATITTPLDLRKVGDLKFGNIISSASTGTVVVAPNATTAIYNDGASSYTSVPGTIQAASFEVTGSPLATYSISTIAPITVTSVTSGGTYSMNVTTFTTNPGSTAGVLNNQGKQIISVGATLEVGVSQPAGFYTSKSPFTVTVNYN